jgi:predicted RNA polymerase sigma factor
MQFLISMHINPAVLDALTDEEKAAIGEGQVLGALVRRYGQFEGCEDAAQEAVLTATVQWPADRLPENPRGWLMAVASRRLIDQMRRRSPPTRAWSPPRRTRPGARVRRAPRTRHRGASHAQPRPGGTHQARAI